MIPIKNSSEIKKIRQGGKVHQRTLKKLLKASKPGIKLNELDKMASDLIKKEKAQASFLGYQGFPANICVSVNEGIVHGVPTGYKLKEGDLLTIDLGIYLKGFHTDGAETIIVGSPKTEDDLLRKRKFLRTGEKALKEAIQKAREGLKVGDISHAIQRRVEDSGYSIVRKLTGHGVGRELHEDPFIPGFGSPGTGEVLKSGMVLAIEVIYAEKNPRMKVLADGWTIVTQDRGLAGLFEKTVLVTPKGAEILT